MAVLDSCPIGDQDGWAGMSSLPCFSVLLARIGPMTHSLVEESNSWIRSGCHTHFNSQDPRDILLAQMEGVVMGIPFKRLTHCRRRRFLVELHNSGDYK